MYIVSFFRFIGSAQADPNPIGLTYLGLVPAGAVSFFSRRPLELLVNI